MTIVKVLSIVLLTLSLGNSVASAHAVMKSSNPRAYSTIPEIPQNISVAFTEPPAPGTTVHVIDGCTGSVATQVASDDEELDVDIGTANPGRWRVHFEVVSATDGHSRRGDFGFRVRGKSACRTLADHEPVQLGGRDTQAADPSDSGGFPVVPFAIGSIMIIGIALLLRRAVV